MIVVAVNFRFLDKGEGGGEINDGSRDHGRGGEGGPRGKGGGGLGIDEKKNLV